MMNDIDAYKLDVEKKILELIAKNVQSQKMTPEQARQVAQLVLAKLQPTMSLAAMHQVLPQLSQEIEQLKDVLDPVVDQFNQRIISLVDSKIEEMVQKGKILELHQLAETLISGEQQ